MMRIRCDQTEAWGALKASFEAGGKAFDLRDAFANDPQRFESFSQSAPHVFADLSKNRIDAATQTLLLELAQQCGLERHRDAMFAGELVNSTENRAAMHFLLRKPAPAQYFTAHVAINKVADQHAEIEVTLNAMLAYAEEVRANRSITDVVNIGIGGSDLGPQMAVLALAEFATTGQRFHFVSNVDGHELAGVLAQCQPQNTLFLIASKTFTTTETMTNAASAKHWFETQGGQDIGAHFAALTTNVAAANAFGIHTTFGFWDWVGGRYSLWSAIGLPIAIAIGAAGFRDLLAGAHAMDEHFRTAPLAQNLPVRLGLLDVWYRNFHGFTSRSIAPYSSALRRLPAFLQQLEMESNGKRVDAQGHKLPFETAPVLWGEPGTNGQHAYFQMLHQGSDVTPVEFILVAHRDAAGAELDAAIGERLDAQHRMLLANGLAQGQALMLGRTAGEARAERAGAAPSSIGEDALAAQRTFPGNRPSTTLLLERINPRSLGALIALYEHRVFTSGALWGINSFDQWGVELGKSLSNRLLPMLQGQGAGTPEVLALDGSTAGLLARLGRA